ncbi:MAG TPA: putative metal-binding protein [Chthoniobacterales bacterium]|nr:putative metal-binding protein [Chthoniobacterales bacterium]
MALVDPQVAIAKFEREVQNYLRTQQENIQRGRWLLKAEFPEVLIAFATPKTRPAAVCFGAIINFQDYDLVAPSVRLVNPFTGEPYLHKTLPTKLPRRVAAPAAGGPAPEGLAGFQIQDLMTAHSVDDIPFLCLPGVREYHEHPGHTGDPWLLHRGGPEGTLYFLVEKIAHYGLEPISGFEMRINVAFQQTIPPE